MDFSVVAFDIDGTLVTYDLILPASSIPLALEKTVEPSPKRVPIVLVIASSMSLTLLTVTVGPKVSS